MGSQHVPGVTWIQGAIKVRTRKPSTSSAEPSGRERTKKNRLRKFEDSRCARSYPRCRPGESRHRPRSYSALSSLGHSKWQAPHDVSVRALVAFPREKFNCVVIVIVRASPREFAISRGLRHPYSFEEHASPEGANCPRGFFCSWMPLCRVLFVIL